MLETKEMYKSKWGYHPCSYETFLKLKKLKKDYYQFLKDFHTWVRWERKTVNRVGPEPAYDDKFIDKSRSYGWAKPMPKTSKHPYGYCKIYPKKFTDHGILDLFEEARKPREVEVSHFSRDVLKKIDDLI